MSNKKKRDSKECPLCMEILEIDDFNFFPCPCKYQVCRFCWNRIITSENGLCPACRRPYNSEEPALFQPLTNDEIKQIKRKQKNKNGLVEECRKDLNDKRVLQENLLFIINLPTNMPKEEELLKSDLYFGKYGTVVKAVVNQTQVTTNGTSTKSAQSSSGVYISAYVTYRDKWNAMVALLDINAQGLNGMRSLKASFGTTKYCSQFLKGQSCPKKECMYLHAKGDDKASFTKEDMAAGKHTQYEAELIQQFRQQLDPSVLPEDHYFAPKPAPKPLLECEILGSLSADSNSSCNSGRSPMIDETNNIILSHFESPSATAATAANISSNAVSPTSSSLATTTATLPTVWSGVGGGGGVSSSGNVIAPIGTGSNHHHHHHHHQQQHHHPSSSTTHHHPAISDFDEIHQNNQILCPSPMTPSTNSILQLSPTIPNDIHLSSSSSSFNQQQQQSHSMMIATLPPHDDSSTLINKNGDFVIGSSAAVGVVGGSESSWHCNPNNNNNNNNNNVTQDNNSCSSSMLMNDSATVPLINNNNNSTTTSTNSNHNSRQQRTLSDDDSAWLLDMVTDNLFRLQCLAEEENNTAARSTTGLSSLLYEHHSHQQQQQHSLSFTNCQTENRSFNRSMSATVQSASTTNGIGSPYSTTSGHQILATQQQQQAPTSAPPPPSQSVVPTPTGGAASVAQPPPGFDQNSLLARSNPLSTTDNRMNLRRNNNGNNNLYQTSYGSNQDIGNSMRTIMSPSDFHRHPQHHHSTVGHIYNVMPHNAAAAVVATSSSSSTMMGMKHFMGTSDPSTSTGRLGHSPVEFYPQSGGFNNCSYATGNEYRSGPVDHDDPAILMTNRSRPTYWGDATGSGYSYQAPPPVPAQVRPTTGSGVFNNNNPPVYYDTIPGTLPQQHHHGQSSDAYQHHHHQQQQQHHHHLPSPSQQTSWPTTSWQSNNIVDMVDYNNHHHSTTETISNNSNGTAVVNGGNNTDQQQNYMSHSQVHHMHLTSPSNTSLYPPLYSNGSSNQHY